MTIALLILLGVLAFANGANDNGKGVATLVGVGAAKPMGALVYATVATVLGGAVSFFLAGGLLKGFSGNWLFEKGIVLGEMFYVAVLIGTCGWVLLANFTGMPVSTTHAILGALCGAGLVAFGNARFQWPMLGQKLLLPLAVSPFLSLAVVYLLAGPVLLSVGYLPRRPEPIGPSVRAHGSAGAANAIHCLSCGLISFARGWNDTPKIAALSVLSLSTVSHGTAIGFVIVTAAMAVGGIVMGRKVLQTLSKRLTPLPLAESLTASMVTATLVGLASWIALPVSTTHVATGSIIGAGLKNNPRDVKWKKVTEIGLSWLITLPVAGLIAAAAKYLIR